MQYPGGMTTMQGYNIISDMMLPFEDKVYSAIV